jgi:hypothetical protein
VAKRSAGGRVATLCLGYCLCWADPGRAPRPSSLPSAPFSAAGSASAASSWGMARQGYDLQLTRYGDEGWRATFYPAGRGHSVTSAVGPAWERGPWTAVQRAALNAGMEAA